MVRIIIIVLIAILLMTSEVNAVGSSETVSQQTQATYENYNKLKTLVDLGYFLENYVVEGGEVTKDIYRNDTVNVTDIVVSLDNDVTRREATSFTTKIANTTYYLDYQSGDFTFGTAHAVGSYLPVAEVTTDGNCNVATITDKRGTIGGFRLKKGLDVEDQTYIQGMEYLVYYHEKLRSKQPVKLIFSGDSTTYGVAITDPDYYLHTAALNMLYKHGMNYVTTVNAGQSGMRTPQWNTVFLANDLAQNPDLYVLRWGLNDAADPSMDRLKIFTDNLREGLAKIRAAKTANELSIVLMMPNSTNDPANGRDAVWFNAIYPIIKQAARDYQCTFIDTYHYLLDSTNVTWEDEDVNGVHIHPTNIGNAWIISLMEDVLIPPILRNYGVTNVSSTKLTKAVTDAPSTYPYGVSVYRTGSGFPYDGVVNTTISLDGVVVQQNSSFQALTREGIAIRRGMRNVGVPTSIGDDAWSPWLYVYNTELPFPLTLQNAWEPYGGGAMDPGYYTDGSTLHLRGMIKNGSTTGFSTIAVLPAVHRSSKWSFYDAKCATGQATLKITELGEIQVINVPSNEWLSLEGITLRVEQ